MCCVRQHSFLHGIVFLTYGYNHAMIMVLVLECATRVDISVRMVNIVRIDVRQLFGGARQMPAARSDGHIPEDRATRIFG